MSDEFDTVHDDVDELPPNPDADILHWKSRAQKVEADYLATVQTRDHLRAKYIELEAEKAQLQVELDDIKTRVTSLLELLGKSQARVKELEAEKFVANLPTRQHSDEAWRHKVAALEEQLKQAGEDSRMLDWLDAEAGKWKAEITVKRAPAGNIVVSQTIKLGLDRLPLRDVLRAAIEAVNKEG